MTDEQVPDVDDVKIRLSKDDIPVDDETEYKSEEESADVVDELRNLGRQFGETMRTAWNSEERRHFENEIREGVQTFAEEVDKALKDVRSSEPAQRARSEAADLKDKAASADIGQKTQSSLAQGLRWFSNELGKLADSFTTQEKGPEDIGAEEEVEE
jgi:signal recognition particle GTPase